MARVIVKRKKTPSDFEDRYTIADIMKIMGVCRATVYNYFKYNDLDHFREGTNAYVYKRVFDKWLKENELEDAVKEWL